MKSMIVLLVVVLSVLPGCGSDTDATPKEDTTDSAPAMIEDSEGPAKVANESVGSDALPEPILLAQAEPNEEPARTTITNEGEKLADPSSASTSPTFDDESKADDQAESSFEWVEPDEGKSAGEDESVFEWVEEEPKETPAEAAAREEAVKQVALEKAKAQEAIEAAQRKADEDTLVARTKMEKELRELREEQVRIMAEILATQKQADERATANEKSQEELVRLKEQAEQEKMKSEALAEAARKDAEESAVARAKAESELVQVREETARIQADAAQARMRAESEAKAKAEIEAALVKVKENQEKSEVAAKPVDTKTPEPAPAAPKSTKPMGTIQLAKLEQGVIREGVYGILLNSEGKIENLNGAKVELAAYFFDSKGTPLKDRDKTNRSSRGQVYVGKESVVPSDVYAMKGELFIPFKQLDLRSKEPSELQVELVLWEYSQGRGKRLVIAKRTKFTHTPLPDPEQVNLERRGNISGTWQIDDALVTITQEGEEVVINRLGIVPYNIISEKWTYVDGVLRGSVINKRKLPPLTRVWEFDLQVSEDGNSLSGNFHRSDRKGNFAFDSEPFVWTRTSQ